MKTQTSVPVTTTLDELFQQWKSEHADLDQCALELTAWLHEQSKIRNAQFREAVARIADLNRRLAVHFQRENDISEQLIATQGGATNASKAVQRQSERDHTNVSCRLKHLIDRMQEGEAETDAWKTAVRELNLILDVLEQHEEQEAESVGWLIPRDSTKTLKGTST